MRTTIDSRMQQAANQIVDKQGDAIQKVADVEWGRAGSGFSTDPATYASQHGKVQPFAQYWASNKGMLTTFIRESAEYRQLRDAGTPDGEALAKLQDGDLIRLSAEEGTLSTTANISDREAASPPEPGKGTGRELFGMFRHGADEAEKGGSAMLALAGL